MESNPQFYSSSSDALNQPWNVFLSFRGDDTRKNFTGHLYMALKQAGIKTFMDDSGLQTGEDIPDHLLKAIRGSEISLVVFSSNYASSSWCLNELVEILECKHRMGQLVYPVFYNVSPSVVRNRRESFAAAFEIHQKRYVSNLDKVDRWKAALTEAANLSGYDLQNDADGSLVKISGLDKLESIKRIDMAGCENLSITFEKSLFEFLSGIGERIDIYLPMRDVPRWFRNQVSESSILSLHVKPTVPCDSLGVIAWLNVDHTTDNEPVTHSKAVTAIVANHVCRTYAWKPVPQSWIIFIRKNYFLEWSKICIEVTTNSRVKSIGGHLIY